MTGPPAGRKVPPQRSIRGPIPARNAWNAGRAGVSANGDRRVERGPGPAAVGPCYETARILRVRRRPQPELDLDLSATTVRRVARVSAFPTGAAMNPIVR